MHVRLFLLGLLALAGCAADSTPGEAPPALGVRVEWLTGNPHELPDNLGSIRLVVFTGDDGSFRDTTVSVGNLMETEGGRPYLSHPLLSDLPTGRPVRITIEGNTMSGALAYLGHVGPLVLSPGERRYAALEMYPVGEAGAVNSGGLPGRMLATTTALPDGRVLVAGGFDAIAPGTCPAGLAAEARCFALEATSDALLFDPSTGQILEVAGGMVEARGGHTATLLPGGRVLLAGGAAKMLLALVPLDPVGFDHVILPMHEDGSEGALASFEIFLPNANAEAEDVDRDGDPGRGGFTGAADAPTAPGRLEHERFMHAAAVAPGHPERVLLAGGMGSDGGAGSYEVYDDQRPGGYGVYDASGNALLTPRESPAAVPLSVPDDGSIWITGGTLALSNGDLAEVWTPSADDPNGSVAPATDTAFPGASTDDMDPHPEYAYIAPSAAPLGDGAYALVVGWLGIRCAPGTANRVFPTMPDGSDTVPCGSLGMSDPEAYLIDGTTGLTYPQDLSGSHAFGAIATLDDGSVAITGGLVRNDWQQQPGVDLLTGDVDGGIATPRPSNMLATRRAFHGTAAIQDRGIFSFGGIAVVGDPPNVTLLSAAEVLYFPRSPISQ